MRTRPHLAGRPEVESAHQQDLVLVRLKGTQGRR